MVSQIAPYSTTAPPPPPPHPFTLFSSPLSDSCSEIYGHGKNVQKSPFYSVMPPYPNAFDTHNIINKAQHSRKRRVMAQAFSDAALRGMEKHVLNHVRTFVELLGDCAPHKSDGNKHSGRNMVHWTRWLTFDVIGDLCYGKAFGMLTLEEWRCWPSLIDMAIHRHAIVSIIRYSTSPHIPCVLIQQCCLL